IGVVTDYAIFYFSAFRRDLRTGKEPLDAARHAATTITPVVVVAGVTVAVGTAALLVAELELFQRLGPGLAVTVAVAALVASTFVPAAMAWLGRGVFWPRGIEVVEAERREPGWRRRLARVGVNRAVALVVLAVGVGGLVYVSLPIGDADVGANLIEDVPTGHEVERAAEAAATGFVPGIVAPGEVLVSAPGIGRDGAALDRLGSLIGEEPGIAAVLGPGRLPAGEDPGLFVSPEGNVARYAVFLADPPYSADAIDRMEALRERLPGLVEAAGFPDAEVAVAGDTMLAQEIVSTAEDDLIRIAIATVVIDLLLLALFLRSLVIPVVLLALSALGVLVAVATTSWVFTTFLGYDGLTFYVPFAVAVLLVAFGSDYNIFVVARIWSEARHRDLREAIVEGGSQAGSAIAAAGTVLAASFAMLALVPIGAFRQFALGMAVGVLVDTFFIRTVLLPAAIALLGRWSAWPGRDLEPAEVVSQPTEEPVPPAVRV
ncbi:MAG TPA: MMPL family transporter, partial [Acidimicrobiia bacterium]|nr:MMPL family transporter [Acidimicrobiia bacterium]